MSSYYFDSAGTGAGAATINFPMTSSYIVTSPSGVQTELRVEKNTKNEISAKLYMKYLKSKLSDIEVKTLKARINKLEKLISYSSRMGQAALYEALAQQIAVLVRESELVACGVDSFVDINVIKKFIDKVKDKVVKFKTLEEFPRVVPKRVQDKILAFKDKGLFDEYWVLFIDLTDENLKSTKEKIREKDPILFGQFSHQKNRFYFIDDWVDELCDLTLDKFISKIRVDDPEFELDDVPDISKDRFDKIVQEIKERADKLANTNSGNFVALMQEQDKQRIDRSNTAKKPWWKFWNQ